MHPLAHAALLGIALCAATVPVLAQDKSTLAGNWTADLRPEPQAPAYPKAMTLAVAADGTLTGRFYEHQIERGRVGATNGRPCFAFRTQDGTGPYHSSGCLIGDRIEGQTWSEGRNFILMWTATRNVLPK
ncbi:hypothetical protein [Novosphingobium sp. UBA1939]|jgi:hypothetical protein|uniref:hypothetical protein n=1 Tax=Novosphingobium sp. UBA1939 TaxID=1946982 RepID=UPI000DB28800|nr:hypothetical protein [Novosphingobium sp. UBA1939]PZR89014.1 MAG: hypothetical protein DI537_22185 [Stutzerimonas stutzeri]